MAMLPLRLLMTVFRSRYRALTVGLVSATVVLSHPMHAQDRPREGEPAIVNGEIRAQGTKDPIADAEVLVDGVPARRADDKGRFSIQVPSGAHLLEVRRIGFAAAVARLQLEPGARLNLVFELPHRAAQLDTIEIVGRWQPYGGKLAGFYERRARKEFGQFFGPEELEKLTLSRTSDLFHRAKGVDVKCLDHYCTTRGLELVGRGQSTFSGRPECPVEYYVDGVRWNAGALGVDVLNPEAIAAVEVYIVPSQVPAQFGGPRARCGVVVFWLKTGER